MDGSVSVTVAARVRPFNERELNMNSQLCVSMDMNNGSTTLMNPSSPRKEAKTFSFDYSFWSHDDYYEDESGYIHAKSDKYADQQHVFDRIGMRVLDRAWEGYHCCLFAYGQTGAGKSYSMVGYGANPGIVPISCREIFHRIDVNQVPNLSFEVSVSMLEIYNEKVQDLLRNPKDRPMGGLEIRENKEMGIYVQGVTDRAVDSYEDIEAVVAHGTTNRTVAATLMNATSSRAHTVLCIDIKQKLEQDGATGIKLSTTYLVDLAGSEKLSKTGVAGDRLKEGCAINKSLTTLGNVIEKLAERAEGKKVVSIPYRDSKLTRLLQNALGGSCMTVMIVAISPAANNYDESLSTLRYADRAKKIKNVAVVNENPQEKLIRNLREENQKLMELLQGRGAMISSSMGDPNELNQTQSLEARLKEERERYQASVADKENEVKELEKYLSTMQQDFQERIKETKKSMVGSAQKKSEFEDTPHFSNLHEDTQLTGKLHYVFPKEKEVLFGKRPPLEQQATSRAPDIILAGLGVHVNHGKVVNTGDDGVFLRVSPPAATTTFVNGDNKGFNGGRDMVKLSHGDRVVIGQNYVFVFSEGRGETGEQLILSGKASFEAAKEELCEKQGDIQHKSEEELNKEKLREEEFERKLEAANAAKLKVQQEAAMLIKRREEEFQEKMEFMNKQFDAFKAAEASAELKRRKRKRIAKSKLLEIEKVKEAKLATANAVKALEDRLQSTPAVVAVHDEALKTEHVPERIEDAPAAALGENVQSPNGDEVTNSGSSPAKLQDEPIPIGSMEELHRASKEAPSANIEERTAESTNAQARGKESEVVEELREAPSRMGTQILEDDRTHNKNGVEKLSEFLEQQKRLESSSAGGGKSEVKEELTPSPAGGESEVVEELTPLPAGGESEVVEELRDTTKQGKTSESVEELRETPKQVETKKEGNGETLDDGLKEPSSDGESYEDTDDEDTELQSYVQSPQDSLAADSRVPSSRDLQPDWAEEKQKRENEWAEERLRREKELSAMQREFDERQRAAEREARRQLDELERRSRLLNKRAEEKRQHESDQIRMNDRLMVLLPMVKEGTAIAEELNKNIVFKPRLHVSPDENGPYMSDVRVAVIKKPENVVLFLWDVDTMENRLFLMRELLEKWCDDPSFDANAIPCDEDPFWDPLEDERYFGSARLYFQSLSWQVETEVEARIVGADGSVNCGALQLELWPIDKNGGLGVPVEEAIEFPDQFLAPGAGQFRYMIGVNRCVGSRFGENDVLRCEFQLLEQETSTSIKATYDGGGQSSFDFKYEYIHEPRMTAELLDLFAFTPVHFRLYIRDQRLHDIHAAWTALLRGEELKPAALLSVESQGDRIKSGLPSKAGSSRRPAPVAVVSGQGIPAAAPDHEIPLDETMRSSLTGYSPLWRPPGAEAHESHTEDSILDDDGGLSNTMMSNSMSDTMMSGTALWKPPGLDETMTSQPGQPLWQPPGLDDTITSQASLMMPNRPQTEEVYNHDPNKFNVNSLDFNIQTLDRVSENLQSSFRNDNVDEQMSAADNAAAAKAYANAPLNNPLDMSIASCSNVTSTTTRRRMFGLFQGKSGSKYLDTDPEQRQKSKMSTTCAIQ